MRNLKEIIFGKICTDCKGRYRNWDEHAFSKRHLRFVRAWAYAHGQGEEFEKGLGKLL